MPSNPRSSSGRRQRESDAVETVIVAREEITVESELAEATPLESEIRLDERAHCPWPPDLNPEWIGAAGKLFRLAVLDRYGVFRVAVQICAKVASGDGSIVPRDTEVACRAYELNQLLAADPGPAALNFAANGYNQLLPTLRAYAGSLCTIADYLPVSADELDVPKGVAFSAGNALFDLQLAASQVGMGIAGCVAGEVDPVAGACIELLGNPSLLCACGAYDTTELFNQYNGTKSYNDVCRLLCGSERLLLDAATQLPNDACSTDYQIDDAVVTAGLLFNAADESLNPGAASSLPARTTAASSFKWAAAIAAMRQPTALPAPMGRYRLSTSS
jgi:hypothetical protein